MECPGFAPSACGLWGDGPARVYGEASEDEGVDWDGESDGVSCIVLLLNFQLTSFTRSPTPYDALCMGIPFINPILEVGLPYASALTHQISHN